MTGARASTTVKGSTTAHQGAADRPPPGCRPRTQETLPRRQIGEITVLQLDLRFPGLIAYANAALSVLSTVTIWLGRLWGSEHAHYNRRVASLIK